MSKESTTHFNLDPHNLPTLTEEEHSCLATMTELDIDFSDIPETDEAFWSGDEVIQASKKPVYLCLDEDIVAWLHAHGKAYQSQINGILRDYIEAHSA